MKVFLTRPAIWPALTEDVIWSSPLTRDPWQSEEVIPRWSADEGQFVPSSDNDRPVTKSQQKAQTLLSANLEPVVDADAPKKRHSKSPA